MSRQKRAVETGNNGAGFSRSELAARFGGAAMKSCQGRIYEAVIPTNSKQPYRSIRHHLDPRFSPSRAGSLYDV
jgi:hypothetical protein